MASGIDGNAITAVVLAGGMGRRMGGRDKGLTPLAGSPLIARVLERLRPQVGRILINANRNADSYAAFGYPVVADTLSGYAGPLAGMLSAMDICQSPYLLSVPCDSPFIPPDLAARLADTLSVEQAEISVAHDGQRLQPVFALMQTRLKDSLQSFLEHGGRKIDAWYAQRHMVAADFSEIPDTFINLNTPEDLLQASARLENTANE